jgi:hydroxymethylglutaryl-CoA reductase (NADPH)
VVPGDVVKKILKAEVEDLVRLNTTKNLLGSVGGFNAHAANVLTAVYLATGQDPAQNVESSQCLTFMEAVRLFLSHTKFVYKPIHLFCRIPSPTSPSPNLLITITMPCIELGTVGGGTNLLPQQSVLEMLGLKGAHPTDPGANAKMLARVVVGGAMAEELGLLGAHEA